MPRSARALETPAFLHDWPLRDEDSAYFYFDEYARTLARLIADQKTRTPLAIGISGAWGAGKTTLMKRVRKMLDETRCLDQPTQPALLSFANPQETPQQQFRACRTIWFDAWKYTGEDHILAALLRGIVSQMRSEGFLGLVKAKLTGPENEKVKWANVALNALVQFTSTGTYELNLGDYQIDTPFKSASAFFDYFDEALTRLIASWIHGDLLGKEAIDEKSGALVIFIDDLDRCLPARTVEVLEAIKLFLDKVGCVFVLGADIAIIQQAVASHYKDAGVTGESAKDYLEKVVQLRFELPPILADIMKTYLKVERCADTMILDNWKVLMAGSEINPRRIKALINDLNLQWAILRNIGQAENVNRGDFICWQILARAAPGEFLQTLRDIGDLDTPELQKKYIDDILHWAVSGSAESEQHFKQFIPHRRFRMVLRAIRGFSSSFDAVALNSFLHLVSPSATAPEKPIHDEPPEEIAPQEAAAPKFTLAGVEKYLEIGGIQFVPIPKGPFVMGSREDNPIAEEDERPQHTVNLDYEYWIGKYPVTNQQYAAYAKQARVDHPTGKYWAEKKDHPVVGVSWRDALLYCWWFEGQFRGQLPPGYAIHMPNEPEWEKAARGEYGNEWPWGDVFNSTFCNTFEGGKKSTSPVGDYSPRGDSPFGCEDMAGNVWEWTRSELRPYPYDATDGREDETYSTSRVLRGGSWSFSERAARCACRYGINPYGGLDYIGFRVVVLPSSTLRSENSGPLSL